MMFFVDALSLIVSVAVLLVLARMKPAFAGLTVKHSWQWALVAAVSFLAWAKVTPTSTGTMFTRAVARRYRPFLESRSA